MKRIFIFLLTLMIVLVQAETWTVAYAAANIPLACSVNQYSVDRITGKDQFTKLACYNENQFQQAYDFMLAESTISPNVVIRHDESYSPMNIVASDRSMAYSQNHTYLFSDTITIFKDKALTIPATYINQSNPLYYYKTEISTKASTESVNPSDLVAEVEINGARGFIKVNAIDIIPLIYVENRANDWYISFTTRNSLDNSYTGHIIRPNITQYIVYNITNTTKTGTVTLKQIRAQIDTALYVNSYDYGIAPDWLALGTYYSPDGINFYTDMDLKNPVLNGGQTAKYYNYYDYTNLRSKTSYTGLELDEYFMYFAGLYPTYSGIDIKTSAMYPYNLDTTKRDIGNLFVNAQNTYGMNALMIYAMALHESGYGTSGYARTRNNLFGWGAYDSDPDNAYTFATLEQGINEHMGINLRSYLDVTNTSTPLNTFYASNIGNKGAGINTRYASDPWWSVKIAGIAFRIDRYLGLKDFDNQQLAILSNDTRTFYKDRGLQTTAYTINTRATNYPIIDTASYNNTYYTQSTNPIVNGNIVTTSTTGLVVYDWDNSKVYLNQSHTTLVNTSKTPVTVISDTDELLVYVTNWDWLENNLFIKGWAALKNTNMATSIVTHQVKIINMDDNTFVLRDLAVAVEDYELSIGNSYDYSNAWFSGSIDVSTIPNGNYRFEIITKTGDTTGTLNLFNSTIDAPRTQTRIIENVLYRSSFNNTRGMRFELSKENGLNIPDITPILPSRFNSTAYITNFSVVTNAENKELLNITGLGFMLGVATGESDEVTHSLVLLSYDGVMVEYPLTSGTGIYDISNNGINYSHAWFYGTDIDITDLTIRQYKVFIVTSTSLYTDAIELRDILIQNNQEYLSSNSKYTLITNTNVRRRYDLKKEAK